MSLFEENESIFELELGRILRIPCQCVQGTSNAHPALLKNLTKQMQKTGKNLLPIVVELLEEDRYEAIQNTQILEAARQANLDFVWCIVVDKQMLTQILVESGELIRIPLLSASEEDIVEVLEYLKTQKTGMRTLNPQKSAKAIIEQRNQGKLNNLNFLTTKRCGIGKITLDKISKYLLIE